MCALAVGPADPLGGFTHSLADYVGNPGDELPVGGLAPVGTDGVAEVAAENVHVRPGPGDLDQVADAPLHPGSGGVELGGDLGIEADGSEVKISGSNILGDKAYGTNSIRTYITEQRASYTIPPKSNVIEPWFCDFHTYKERQMGAIFPLRTDRKSGHKDKRNSSLPLGGEEFFFRVFSLGSQKA